eukprot:scaffold92919_cov48-Phaeocystis_antarctica.AAC.4
MAWIKAEEGAQVKQPLLVATFIAGLKVASSCDSPPSSLPSPPSSSLHTTFFRSAAASTAAASSNDSRVARVGNAAAAAAASTGGGAPPSASACAATLLPVASEAGASTGSGFAAWLAGALGLLSGATSSTGARGALSNSPNPSVSSFASSQCVEPPASLAAAALSTTSIPGAALW